MNPTSAFTGQASDQPVSLQSARAKSARLKFRMRGTLVTNSFTQQMNPDRKLLTTSVFGNGQLVQEVPYISANSGRALIRRAASDVIEDMLEKLLAESYQDQDLVDRCQAAGTPLPGMISRDLYLSIRRGAYARTGMNAGGATFQNAILTRDHVFAGLFGGGALVHESRFRFENSLIPMLNCVKKIFPADVHHDCIEAWPSEIVTKTLMAPRDDFAKMPKHPAIIDKFEEAFTQHQATKVAQREDAIAAKNEGGSASKDDLAIFGEIEAIVPGVPLFFGMSSTQTITPAQMGLLITATHRWVNRNVLGGAGARGFGSFAPSIKLWLDGSCDAIDLFHGSAPEIALTDDPRVQACIAAMHNELIDAIKTLDVVYPCTAASAVKIKLGKKAKATAEA